MQTPRREPRRTRADGSKMKKNLTVLLTALLAAGLLGGCGNGESTDQSEATEGTNNTETTAAVLPKDLDLGQYVTLGEYKDVTYNISAKVQYSEEEVMNNAFSMYTGYVTAETGGIQDRAAQEGDTVNLDYAGTKDGVAFSGGTATNQQLTLGAGQFIEGFEEGLIGANKGDTLALDLTFPEVYSNSPEMAGQAVVFNVTVNSITTSVVPELTEDYVTTNTEYDSIDAYKVSVREDLEEANTNTMKNNKINSILKEVVENAEISSYPETLIEYYTYEMEIYYEQYAGYYGMKIADFITAVGMTEEQYNAEVKAYAESRSDQELVLSAIVEAEGMELTDAEYTEGLAKFVTDYGYESEEQLLESASEEEIRESILWNKAIELITEQAIEL